MAIEKTDTVKGRKPDSVGGGGSKPTAPEVPAMFRRVDWWTFAVTTVLVLLGYLYTLAPDVTLEDSGELAVASYYAGVPHPPGYPVWTIYTWLFTVLVPISNIAWRVALSSAVAGALSCGLLALMVSRGCSMILESIPEYREIEKRTESLICAVAGYVGGMLLGFNGFMWSQAVIVEVYTLSVLSLMGVLVLLMRWMYAPGQMRYLYWAFFIFGICFTNHQTLIVAAMGVEVAILAIHPKLGRDLFAANSIVYVIGLIARANGMLTTFDNNPPLFMIYNMVGLGSMIVAGVVAFKTEGLGSEWKPILIMGVLWAVGSAFYFFMPISSMTNPPLNWGYPRTWEGFLHALTRGQYEKANPTDIFKDPLRFIGQLFMYLVGAIEEFNLVFLLVALVPFFFFARMQKRERAWLIGLTAIWFCLAVILLMLLNPAPDRQSKELNRVFFTASHVMVAMMIGYGLSLIAASLLKEWERVRIYAIYAMGAASMIAFYVVVVTFQGDGETLALNRTLGVEPSADVLVRGTSVFTLVLALGSLGLLLAFRQGVPAMGLLAVFALMPVKPVLSHWSDNEQRGHLFGYWFGHDMFTPPFGIYPEMAKNAVLFGGTDPGRFNPTYMIFCESFIPPSKKPLDPNFDRRDVYLITQNALADGTYLNYIRAHYNRSAQKDPPFLQEMLRTSRGPLFSGITRPLDELLAKIGDAVEARRRAQGVYPPKEILTPSPEESQKSFEDYIADAQMRYQRGQLKPGEDVKVVDNKIQVSGQVAVMAINGLLTKVIFDRNPDHEFYVEESFPLDWMYPHLSPSGIIMKINRQPLAELTPDMVKKDHEFWRKYSERLTGDIIGYETSVKEICDFAEKTYRRRDFSGFKGDRKFVRDDNAQKAFSKLRSAIGGVYRWRFMNSRTPEEQARMFKEADFAFRQAFAFCPFSPEAVYRYIELLVHPAISRLDDALLIAETCYKFDRENAAIKGLIDQLQLMRKSQVQTGSVLQNLGTMEQELAKNPTNIPVAFGLVTAYLQASRTNAAISLLDQLVQNPAMDVSGLLTVAKAFADLGQATHLETALRKLVQITPDSPEAWYDLAAIQAAIGANTNAMTSLVRAIILSNGRLASNKNEKNLVIEASKDPRFVPLRTMAEYKALITDALPAAGAR